VADTPVMYISYHINACSGIFEAHSIRYLYNSISVLHHVAFMYQFNDDNMEEHVFNKHCKKINEVETKLTNSRQHMKMQYQAKYKFLIVPLFKRGKTLL
jgi:hypothetical protein